MNNDTNANKGRDVPEQKTETSSLPAWLAEIVCDEPPPDDSDEFDEKQYRPEGASHDETRSDRDGKESEASDESPAERFHYAPSRRELLYLAKYWADRELSFVVDGCLFGLTGGMERRLEAASGERLFQLEKILGAETIEKAVKQVEEECRHSLGDRIWEVFTKGTRAELSAVQDEIRDACMCGLDISPRALPRGLLPSDVGAMDCAPETWQEFGAFCNASGLRKKLAEQVRALWEEFSGWWEETGKRLLEIEQAGWASIALAALYGSKSSKARES